METPNLTTDLDYSEAKHADEFSKAWDGIQGQTDLVENFCCDDVLDFVDSGQIKLTDQLFFSILNESPSALAHPLFQDKILQWQNILRSPLAGKEESRQAGLRLKYIGETLSQIPGKVDGRAPKHEYDAIAFLVLKVEKITRSLIESLEAMTPANAVITYKEKIPTRLPPELSARHPDLTKILLSDEATALLKHREHGAHHPRGFAKAVVAKTLDIPVRTVEETLKNSPPFQIAKR